MERFPNSAPIWLRTVVKVLYGGLLFLIAVFLVQLGPEPWALAFAHWPVVGAAMLTTGAGLVVQAQSFRAVLPRDTIPPSLLRTTNIWAIAAVTSVVAPFFAGIGARTALLIGWGLPLKACVSTSVRQFWLGIEMSILWGAVSVPFTSLPKAHWIAIGLLVLWSLLFYLRMRGQPRALEASVTQSSRRSFRFFAPNTPQRAYVWFALQPLFIAATFFVGFNGLGASLSAADAIALASFTVVLSVIALVPNGLGISDAVWILIATQAGLTLEASVAIALTLRISHLLSSVMLYLCTSITLKRASRIA